MSQRLKTLPHDVCCIATFSIKGAQVFPLQHKSCHATKSVRRCYSIVLVARDSVAEMSRQSRHYRNDYLKTADKTHVGCRPGAVAYYMKGPLMVAGDDCRCVRFRGGALFHNLNLQHTVIAFIIILQEKSYNKAYIDLCFVNTKILLTS